MSELAPGLHTSRYFPPGKFYVFDLRAIGIEGPEKSFALHEDDWARIPGADRERVIDAMTRDDAARGQAELERFLTPFETRTPR